MRIKLISTKIIFDGQILNSHVSLKDLKKHALYSHMLDKTTNEDLAEFLQQHSFILPNTQGYIVKQIMSNGRFKYLVKFDTEDSLFEVPPEVVEKI